MFIEMYGHTHSVVIDQSTLRDVPRSGSYVFGINWVKGLGAPWNTELSLKVILDLGKVKLKRKVTERKTNLSHHQRIKHNSFKIM